MSRPGPRIITAAMVAVAAAGQFRVWSSGRGLWLDELSIAINLRELSWSELSGPLRYHQVAPVGWLFVEKAVREWFGEHELVLRLPSLAAGLLLLAMAAVIAHRAIGGWAAAAAVGLIGLSPSVLYYAGELKQYAVEAAVALFLLVMGGWVARLDRAGSRPPVRSITAWAVAAAVALTLSFSGLVVLAGIAAGLGVGFLLRRRWSWLLTLTAVVLPAALLGAALAWYRRSLPMAPGQQRHFEAGMPPADGGVPGALDWLPRMWISFVESPLAWRSAWWTLALLVAGMGALAVRGRHHWAAMFAGVFAMAVVAAALHGLPLADRVALYLTGPAILLIVAALDGLVRGIRWLAERAGPLARTPVAAPARAAVAVMAAGLVAGLVAAAGPRTDQGISETLAPSNPDLGREALVDLEGRIRPGDVVISYWYSGQLTRWYGPGTGVEVTGRVRLYPADPAQCRPESVDAMLAGASRVWYVHGFRASTDPDAYTVRVARELARRGRIVDAAAVNGADPFSTEPGWFLVDLTAPPDQAPPAVRPDPEFACLGAHDRDGAAGPISGVAPAIA